MKNIKVIFEPGMIEIEIPAGSKIITAIEKTGIPFELPCGGKGICGKCSVKVIQGAPLPTQTEKKILGEKVKDGWRLACQSKLNTNAKIVVESRASSYHKILTSKCLCDILHSPAITKKNFNIPEITLENPISLQQQVAFHLGIEPRLINPFLFRDAHLIGETRFTSIFYEENPIALEVQDPQHCLYGIGFDLGTTTMVLTVFDLESCREIITIVRPNPQIKFGDDVISRIDFSLKGDGLEKLHEVVIEEINKMINEAAKTAGINNKHIYQFVLAGNTVMEHIFLKIPLNSLSRIPFNPVVKGPVETTASQVGLNINPEGVVFVFPVLGGFVGGDTTGLILATGIHREEDIQMGIDIGTNGEIVIGNKDGIIAASTAAGPAFEGGRISCGMRAQTGAIEKFWYSKGNLGWQVIGGNSAKGICGSGLVDIVSIMKEHGIINDAGRFEEETQSPLKKHLVRHDGNFIFALEPEKPDYIHITQKDIREFQAAKAAIRSGIEILMKLKGIKFEKIKKIYLAGALGNFVNVENIKKLKMLPDFPTEKIIPSGNTSLASTLLLLCNSKLKHEFYTILEKTKTVELSIHPEFQNIFTESLFF
ncbi:MAG: ASKHA domain-containing protein [Candidatus Omnitrophica bacterium]|nr:ASKHA domain-containing protein [Candidatus Omnitrophota bacterium]